MLFIVIFVLLAAGQLEATLQRDLLTYINDLRSLHSSGPLISSPTATALAQKAANKLAKDGDTNAVYNPQFSTNHCEYSGKLSQLAKTCAVAWYTTMRDHSWCSPKANGKSRPFVNMVWNITSRAGTGISKGRNGKYYVVTYFSPKKNLDVKGNVHPVRIVTKASDKAKCTTGFTRFGSSCFKFHPEKVSWEEAVTTCAKENATLTSVRNQKEEKFLRTLQERGKGKGWMWIGLHDRTNEGHFTWMDGLEFADKVCAPVSASGGNLENCVAWTTEKPLSCWSDKKCADRNPFMCRMPVDGKSTFRTEILFKKFRWNPNFKDKNSKAFRDMRRGLRVTFNELFQRSSGRIGGGFRSLKIKSVRPISLQGRRRGTAVTLSIQFRAKVADPTLKFQKFLRPSERLISITVDSPVVHTSALSRTVCSFPCKRSANHYCHSWSYQNHHPGYNLGTYNTAYQHAGYANTGYPGYSTYQHAGYHQCPSYCSHYSYSTCPSTCSQSCCTQTASPTAAAPSATKPQPTVKPAATAVVHTGTQPPAPTKAAVNTWGGYSSYQPYTQCNTCQNLYANPLCYAFCDENCCKQSDNVKSLVKTLMDMRGQLRKFKAMARNGKGSDFPSSNNGNAVPIFSSKAEIAVKNLKRNIAKVEAKIKLAQRKAGGENLDDLVFEKAIQSAEKKSREKNTLPNFEKELDNLESEIDDIDIGNAIPVNNGSAKNDMDSFDVDVKAVDYAERSSQYNGTKTNASTNYNNHEEVVKEDGQNQQHSSRNDYRGPGNYNGPENSTGTEQYQGPGDHYEKTPYNGPGNHHGTDNYNGPDNKQETESYHLSRNNYKAPGKYHGSGKHNEPEQYSGPGNKTSYSGPGNKTSYSGPIRLVSGQSRKNYTGAQYIPSSEVHVGGSDTPSESLTSTNSSLHHYEDKDNEINDNSYRRPSAINSTKLTGFQSTEHIDEPSREKVSDFTDDNNGHSDNRWDEPGKQDTMSLHSSGKNIDSGNNIDSGINIDMAPESQINNRENSKATDDAAENDDLSFDFNHSINRKQTNNVAEDDQNSDFSHSINSKSTKAPDVAEDNEDLNMEMHGHDKETTADSPSKNNNLALNTENKTSAESEGNGNNTIRFVNSTTNVRFDDLQNSTGIETSLENTVEKSPNKIDTTSDKINRTQQDTNQVDILQTNSSNTLDETLENTPANSSTTLADDIGGSIHTKEDTDHGNLNPKFRILKDKDDTNKVKGTVNNATAGISKKKYDTFVVKENDINSTTSHNTFKVL